MSGALRPRPHPVRLSEAAAILGATVVPSGVDCLITGITLDSRAVVSGDLYAALPGHVTHGARFAGQAAESGAVACLTDPAGVESCAETGLPVLVIEEPRAHLGALASFVYGQPAQAVQLLAVTGTNGKTTVATMVESSLHAAGRVTGLIGTVGVQIGSDRFAGLRTTPEATDLHAILGVMRDRDVDTTVMEVSSIALDEHRVDGVVYDVAAFTNLSQDHLDYHVTMDAYFESKATLFTSSRARRAIVGIDDVWGRRLAESCTIPLDTWSLLDPHATWHVSRGSAGLEVVGPDAAPQSLTVPMPGAFNVANAVCAFAMARRAGVSASEAAAGIERVQVPGRMQVVRGAHGVVGIVDYAHSPDAIERVLRAVREGHTGRLIAVIGAGGDRDVSKRPLMGQTAADLADVVVITDDNPRSEDPAMIRAAVREGAQAASPAGRAEIHEVGDRAAAVTVAVEMAEPGDVVLVLGKGHEQGQDVNGVVTPFDDAAVLAHALGSGDPA
jgi:UDP-N-acetylmuramoyl-L-alanyl-D-glutamate--2,6-diaminopimelate ligase